MCMNELQLKYSVLEQEISYLLATFSYGNPIDTVTPQQWTLFIIIFIKL